MKNLFFIVAAASLLTAASCVQNDKKSGTSQEQPVVTLSVKEAQYVEDILKDAEKNVNKELVLRGFITHTCKHSGRRCFVIGKDQKTSLRVEAKGNIGGFNRELIGSEVIIKGILRENRLTKEYIDQAEEELKENQGRSEENGETCDAEMSHIQSMREWMKANHRDYYSIYYVEGTDYEVAE